jgi:hypothetical protein
MINIRYGEGDAKGFDGKPVKISPSVALFRKGPALPVVLMPHPAFAQALQAAGKPIPAPVQGLALIDTGATTTCIDGESAKSMGLAANGLARMASASHTSSDCLTYPVQLAFPVWNLQLECAKAMGVRIKNQGFIVLVGRDLLQNRVMLYNGADGAVTLAL